MISRLSHTQLLRFAGLFTWAMVGIPLLLHGWFFSREQLEGAEPSVSLMLWALAYTTFGLVYWRLTRTLGVRRPRWSDEALLLLLTVSAIAVGHFSGTGLGGILLLLVSGVLPWLLPLALGLAWLVLQHLALVPALMLGQEFMLFEAILQSALYAGYSSFAFAIGLVARQQSEARDEQRRLNAELRATRALLAEGSRLSERMRISRELHDLLGHHLTALSLNLEVAGHLTQGRGQEHVRQAHTLAKLLLTDVREAVSQLREDGVVDLGIAIRSLVDGVPGVDIRLDMVEPFQVQDPECAHVLLRCAQELITNVVRHAGARTLWLRLAVDGRVVRVVARDDGRGADTLRVGNGLTGMRERVEGLGGALSIRTAPGTGFQVDIELPLEAAS
ncbi:MAG: sensor histidine kinase [Lysobacteraceae bacterium]